MQDASPSWKSVTLSCIDEVHRPRLAALLELLDPPSDRELLEFRQALDLARARVVTDKVLLHPSFMHLFGDLGLMVGVVTVLRGLTLVFPPRGEETGG